MSTGEICHSTVPGPPSSSSETQDEELLKSYIKLLAIFMQDENSPIIPKVPHRLRQVNENAYEPNVISIGPYHRDKKHLKEMEDMKKSFFDRNVGESRENLLAAISVKEESIRNCYVQTNELSSEEFVDMVVLDGFFIVQLLSDFLPMGLLRRRYFLNEIVYDLLLLENQLPFFVLEEIHEIMTKHEEKPEEFTDLALVFFEDLIGITESSECPTPKKNIKHLLDLIHDTPRWRPSNGTKKEEEETKDHSIKAKNGKTGKNAKRRNFIRCARELEEAGISFEMRDEKKEKCRALDIVFKCNWRKPKLRIPKLMVGDHTERMLRNLIAFEQLLPIGESTYVFDYVNFLDQLINTEKDVQLLCYSDIIENRLGDDQAVAQVFNRICDNTFASSKFHYAGVFEQVNRHWDNRWNKHLANLQRNYFNSPWALLSFLAALLLIFLTIAQTTFTLLTIECHSCLVLFILFGVLLVVIGLVFCSCFG